MIRLIDYSYIFGTVVFTVYGQLILKWRISKYDAFPDVFAEKIIFLLKLFLDPYVMSGFVSAFLASLLWMAAMTKFDVSYAYPFVTAGLTLMLVFSSILFLGEVFSVSKLIGIVLIIFGVVVMYSGKEV